MEGSIDQAQLGQADPAAAEAELWQPWRSWTVACTPCSPAWVPVGRRITEVEGLDNHRCDCSG